MVQVLGVGDQRRRDVGGAPDPRPQLSGRELADLRGPLTAVPLGLLPPGLAALGGIEAGRVVQHRPLVGQPQQVDLRPPRGLRAGRGGVEDLVLRHLLQRPLPEHEPSQAPTTDTPDSIALRYLFAQVRQPACRFAAVEQTFPDGRDSPAPFCLARYGIPPTNAEHERDPLRSTEFLRRNRSLTCADAGLVACGPRTRVARDCESKRAHSEPLSRPSAEVQEPLGQPSSWGIPPTLTQQLASHMSQHVRTHSAANLAGPCEIIEVSREEVRDARAGNGRSPVDPQSSESSVVR